jgi:hypothetical protein
MNPVTRILQGGIVEKYSEIRAGSVSIRNGGPETSRVFSEPAVGSFKLRISSASLA